MGDESGEFGGQSMMVNPCFFTNALRNLHVLLETCGLALSCWNSYVVWVSMAKASRNRSNSIRSISMDWLTPRWIQLVEAYCPGSKPRPSARGSHLFLLLVHSVQHIFPSYFDTEKPKLLRHCCLSRLWIHQTKWRVSNHPQSNVNVLWPKLGAFSRVLVSIMDVLWLSICECPLLVVNV